MNFDNAFEKDLRVAIRIQTPMPDFDNKVGGLHPAGMDVGGITDKVAAVKEKMLNDFLEPLMDAGLIILRGKSHDTASFIVKNPLAIRPIFISSGAFASALKASDALQTFLVP